MNHYLCFPGISYMDAFVMLSRTGTAWLEPARGSQMPKRLRGGPFRSVAGSRHGIAAVTRTGVAQLTHRSRDRFTAPESHGRSWRSVRESAWGFEWIDDSGAFEIRSGRPQDYLTLPPSGEDVAEIAMTLHCGLARLRDGSVRFIHRPASRSNWDSWQQASIRRLAEEHPSARAVAGCSVLVALVDAHGRLHLAGDDAHRLKERSGLVPGNLPRLRSAAVAFGPRLVVLDEAGCVHTFCGGSVPMTRDDLPPAMKEPGFEFVGADQNGIFAIDRDSNVHAFGQGMGRWAQLGDPVIQLLMSANAASDV